MSREQTYARFQERYRSGKTVVGMTCSTMSPVLTEIIGYAGLDFVIVDTEVLSINPETVESMVRAADCTNIVPIIKLKDHSPTRIADALNTGAPMIKVPHASSPEILAQAADAAYFHPRGSRGLCTVSRANRYGQGRMSDLIEWTNREVQIIPIIEDRSAVENIDRLMAVDGIEVYDIGPVDLAHSFGVRPDHGFGNPEIGAALERIVEAADKHGKRVMTVPVFGQPLSPELVRSGLIDKGVRMIFYRTDSVTMRTPTGEAMQLRED